MTSLCYKKLIELKFTCVIGSVYHHIFTKLFHLTYRNQVLISAFSELSNKGFATDIINNSTMSCNHAPHA